MDWSVSQVVVWVVVLLVGGAAGWWWSAARSGTPRAEEARARAAQRREWLKASFEALQRLHFGFVMELDPGRAGLLDAEAAAERLETLERALREVDLDVRAHRYLLEGALAARLGAALDACWTTLAALHAGQRNSLEAQRTVEALREVILELEEALRSELGPPQRFTPVVLDATLLEAASDDDPPPGPVHRTPARVLQPARSVDLSAIDDDEDDAPAAAATPRKPPTYFNLD